MRRYARPAHRAVPTGRAMVVGLVAFFCQVVPAPARAQPIPIIDVPFISQSEALCGGAAAAMVLRFWGARSLTAESFAPLVDRSRAGIRTTALAADVVRRGFRVVAAGGDAALMRDWLGRGWPVIALIEDRPHTWHYVVVVAWHGRSVIVHDPARAPFQVMPAADFDRRWSKADRWMLLAVPDDRRPLLSVPTTPAPGEFAKASAATTRGASNDGLTCDELIQSGVRHAQANDLAAAEHDLAQALGCPDGAAARELAGVRLLQRRWAEVDALAGTAVSVNPSDAYAWKLLGTARFVRNEPIAALDAWNRAGEPVVDLTRVEGLVRTRQRIVERLIELDPGRMLTASQLRRAQRQIAELPSASATSVTYVPAANGLAQVKISVAERPVLPRGVAAVAAAALTAAVRREIDVGLSSPSGGGERLSIGWRFWPNRPRYAVSVRAPAPWGGVWAAGGAYERQPFTGGHFATSERRTAELAWSRWATDRLRLTVSGGADEWHGQGTFGAAAGGFTLTSRDDRLQIRVDGRGWLGTRPFGAWQALFEGRTSGARAGTIGLVRGALAAISADAPRDLWSGGDTGHARPVLLRAHPLLDDGRLRSERLGRNSSAVSMEVQRWRRLGPVSIAAAAFTDIVRTAARSSEDAIIDVDAGAGLRLSPPAVPGTLRLDLAKGLRDGSTALSLVFER